MKCSLLITFRFLSNVINSQLLYDELEPHNGEPINLLHVDNDGNFFGVLRKSK